MWPISPQSLTRPSLAFPLPVVDSTPYDSKSFAIFKNRRTISLARRYPSPLRYLTAECAPPPPPAPLNFHQHLTCRLQADYGISVLIRTLRPGRANNGGGHGFLLLVLCEPEDRMAHRSTPRYAAPGSTQVLIMGQLSSHRRPGTQ